MEKVLTLRLPGPAARRLIERARAEGTTPSSFVRELLARELDTGDSHTSVLERTRRFIGAVSDARVPAGRDARAVLDGWKPDRRG
jgi:hypothetical protein